MKNEDRVHEEVQKTMKSLDGLKRASADEYFFTRLEARMENGKERDERVRMPGLSWGIAAVVALFIINTFTILYVTGSGNYEDDISEQEITALAEEYALTVPSLYEQDINE